LDPGLPKNSWVSWVQASNFNPGMAYAADNNVDNTSKDVRGARVERAFRHYAIFKKTCGSGGVRVEEPDAYSD
jgi:hypothetical protein